MPTVQTQTRNTCQAIFIRVFNTISNVLVFSKHNMNAVLIVNKGTPNVTPVSVKYEIDYIECQYYGWGVTNSWLPPIILKCLHNFYGCDSEWSLSSLPWEYLNLHPSYYSSHKLENESIYSINCNSICKLKMINTNALEK